MLTHTANPVACCAHAVCKIRIVAIRKQGVARYNRIRIDLHA